MAYNETNIFFGTTTLFPNRVGPKTLITSRAGGGLRGDGQQR